VILHQAEDWSGEELLTAGPKEFTWKYEVGGLPWPFVLFVVYFRATWHDRGRQGRRFEMVAGTKAIPAVVSLFNSSFPGADSSRRKKGTSLLPCQSSFFTDTIDDASALLEKKIPR
jgi:hypothetical protein